MKVSGAGSAGGVGGIARAKPAAGGFAPAASSGAAEAAAPGGVGRVSTLTTLDALLALQETPGPIERRKRAIGRAGKLLDALDQVKLTLLREGADPRAALDQLRTAARDARDGTEDAGLESLLDAVDVRAEVELAKDEMARAALRGRAA